MEVLENFLLPTSAAWLMFEMAKSLLAPYASGTCLPSSMEMLVNQKCLLTASVF